MLRFFVALLALLATAPAGTTEAGWALLRNGGQVVLINHAHAPGSGDPANFDIENCTTQRNLSDRGRQQARRMGALFFARAAPIERVLTSRYCRARDTADLAFGDNVVEIFEALDYFEPGSKAEEVQTEAVLERIRGYSGAGNLLMVTHQPNIQALAGVKAREGQAIILSRSGETIGVAARVGFD